MNPDPYLSDLLRARIGLLHISEKYFGRARNTVLLFQNIWPGCIRNSYAEGNTPAHRTAQPRTGDHGPPYGTSGEL